MLSKESVTSLSKSLLKTLNLRLELAKIDLVDKGSLLLTGLICALLAFLFGFIVIIFISIGCAFLLAKVIGYGGAFLVVGGCWLLLLAILIVLRNRIFLGPIIRALYPLEGKAEATDSDNATEIINNENNG
ncbi:MAG: phage holin family protein [Alloprevotella sp.]|nr:phage holin family protein [Alloprevotella sp.]